jgi:hypothetical protein
VLRSGEEEFREISSPEYPGGIGNTPGLINKGCLNRNQGEEHVDQLNDFQKGVLL